MSQQLAQTQSTINSRKHSQIFASAILALAILSAVGFAPVEVIHNATHDTRHSTGFPCH